MRGVVAIRHRRCTCAQYAALDSRARLDLRVIAAQDARIDFDQPVTNVVTPLGNNPPFTNSVTFNNTPQAPLVIDPAAPFSLPGGVTGVPNINAVDPIFRSGRVLQYNFNIQHEALGTVFQAGYIGSQGRRLRLLRDVNQGVNSQRPLRQYGVINSNESSSRSSYNALWISANRRFSKGLTLHHFVHAGALHGSQFRGQFQFVNSERAQRQRRASPV